MPPGSPPVDVEAVVHGIRDASYVCLVTLILIIYDHILTFNVELESFWTLSLTWLRALFFINRYLSIILAILQLYTITSQGLPASCAPLSAIMLYGTCIIVTLSSTVQFTRVYILYKSQKWVTYIFLFTMFCLWGSYVGFVIRGERLLQFHDALLPESDTCPGCRPSRIGVAPWKPLVPLLIQQTILAAMILYKGFTTPAKGEYAKGVMGVLVRDGTIVYLAILFSIILCFVGASVKSLGITLSVSNILLPVFSICTTRLLVNLRAGPSPQRHNDLFAGVEMTGLYLGGYLGGIAPARGVEGAVVTEIGNTTIIEVPIVDLEDARGSSRCGDRMGDDDAASDDHSRCDGLLPTSPSLKVSALGATPGWERWDHRLPTKDLRLPSSSPPDRRLHSSEREDGLLERRQSLPARSVRRHRTSERLGTAKSNTTLVTADESEASTRTRTAARPGTAGTERTLVQKGSFYANESSIDKGRVGSPPLKPPIQ